MKCVELIIQDHKALRRSLEILERMVEVVEQGDRVEIFDIRTVLKFLKTFGDDCHQSMEEKFLFPALLRAAPQEDVFRQMLLEHGEEREFVDAIEGTLNPKHGIGFVRSSRRLIQLLRYHFDNEDVFLCTIAERLLSTEDDEWIVAGFMTRQTQPENYASHFARLERKYAPKLRGTPIALDRRAHA